MNKRLILVTGMIGGLAAFSQAQHAGDNIYAAVGGQIVTVDPTNAVTTPRSYDLLLVLSTVGGRSFWVADVGFDFLPTSTGAMSPVQSARLNGQILTRGLKVRRNTLFYFQSAAYYQVATTQVRSTFALTGTNRHTHFSFFIENAGPGKVYEFDYWFTDAVDTLGNPLLNSPRYRLRFVAPAQASPTLDVTPVPEPMTIAAVGAGMAMFLRRRSRRGR